ncbi:MAG: glycosyltransferase family 4 protein [Candidatus Marinimicrobia bacterium]|nr:glycosyltransferase family 4 protein [Candidatus Neomarinimicrobiota bacterium]
MRKKPLRILHVNSAHSWRGGEKQTLLLASGLKNLGNEVFIACQPRSPLYDRSVKEGINTLPVRMSGEWDLPASWKLSRWLKQHDIDVIHYHTARAHTLGWIATTFYPVQVRILSRRVEFPINKNILSRLKYKKGYDRIIAISNAVKDVLISDGIDQRNVSVIHSGISLDSTQSKDHSKGLKKGFGLNETDVLVGTVGALTAEKDLKTFLRAVKQVTEERENVKFFVVGEGRLMKELIAFTESLDISSKVIFTGYRTDVSNILDILDIWILPSRREGLGNALLEAMAAGLPIAATNAGGIPEVVRDGVGGFLVDPGNHKGLASAIVKLIDDKDLRNRFGSENLERVKNFDITRTIEETQKIYLECLDNSRLRNRS